MLGRSTSGATETKPRHRFDGADGTCTEAVDSVDNAKRHALPTLPTARRRRRTGHSLSTLSLALVDLSPSEGSLQGAGAPASKPFSFLERALTT